MMKKHFLIFAIMVLVGCGGGSIQNDTPLPDSILQMDLQNVMSGQDADQIITQLHNREVTTGTNYVGDYEGPEYSSRLYLTMYPESSQAVADLEAMAERIKDPEVGGQMGFEHIRELTDYDVTVYMSLRGDRVHFFWVQDDGLYWLDTSPYAAMDSIAELLS